jgi:hypothetical protein
MRDLSATQFRRMGKLGVTPGYSNASLTLEECTCDFFCLSLDFLLLVFVHSSPKHKHRL